MPWLAAAALDGEVLAMENGVDTVIGPSGTRLSGGQAQRLALARTLAHPRPVLILDDPFSALDRHTEDTVFADLQSDAKDKVVFLISHRLYHFPQMQKVIFMDGGETTVGTHAQLCRMRCGMQAFLPASWARCCWWAAAPGCLRWSVR